MEAPRYTNVERLKRQAVVETSEQDEELSAYLSAAEAATERNLQQSLSTYADAGGNLPPDLLQAIYLLAATWVANKEASAPVQLRSIPYGYEFLITPHINYKKE